MADIDAAFDDAYRTHRIEAGDDPQTLPNPYSRPTLGKVAAGPDHTGAGVGGGFMVDDADEHQEAGGGFMTDDAPGGFMVDDDDIESARASDGDDDGLGSSSPRVTKPNTIPLSAIPEALANLGLDSTDSSVISLFSETAYVPSSASRRRLAPGVKPDKVVGRQEFQQVAAVLLEEQRDRSTKRQRSPKGRGRGQVAEDDASSTTGRRPTRRAAVKGRQRAAAIIDDADDPDADAAAGGGGGFIVDDADDSEDDFSASTSRRRRQPGASARLDTGSDLTDDDDGEEEDFETRDASLRRRRRGGGRAQRSPTPSDDLSDGGTDSGPSSKRQRRGRKDAAPSIRSTTHLNPLQRENASALYSLLLEQLPASTLPASQRRIGTDAITTIIRAIGEKIPSKEIEEMVEEGAKLFAPATAADQDDDAQATRKSTQAIKGAAAAQGISGPSIGLDEFAGILVHNRLI
ncbi:hypothetical protein PANT_7d00269 [Moesziomyces antarcticus T-34]|uniref:Uncharacterized protein n=1 Tax=Pseudozyma antarctica (strain T-34) TaxID=1151754 RepID=M9LZI0_PSEA3|nr:hypothetical protein PANT_7d00269 [Moesziomyces antarcticus T-34]